MDTVPILPNPNAVSSTQPPPRSIPQSKEDILKELEWEYQQALDKGRSRWEALPDELNKRLEEGRLEWESLPSKLAEYKQGHFIAFDTAYSKLTNAFVAFANDKTQQTIDIILAQKCDYNCSCGPKNILDKYTQWAVECFKKEAKEKGYRVWSEEKETYKPSDYSWGDYDTSWTTEFIVHASKK
jgi:hypothetical protein